MKVKVKCLCPGKPRHEEDTITLSDQLPFRAAVALRNEVGVLYLEEPNADLADVLGVLTEGYLLRGVESWTLRDGKDAIPPSRENIRKYLLGNAEAADVVADAADDLYRKAVMLPLLRKGASSSPPMPTEDGTSAPAESSTTPASPTGTTTRRTSRPTPLRPSSITTSRTDGIEVTISSPDGDFNSSQRSA